MLSNELGCPLVSFGEVPALALIAGETHPSREALQDLGQELVRREPEAFCRGALSSATLRQDGPVVIDGLRHIALLPVLAKLLEGRHLIVIFVDAPVEERVERLGGGLTVADLNKIDAHPVEAQLAQIRERADIVIDTRLGLEESFQVLWDWLSRTTPVIRSA